MDYIQINKYSSVPLYEQMKDSMLHAIESGILTPGQKLPTEEEICRQFDISRPVVRQAYSALQQSGRVRRERGRGTFVKELDNRGLFMNHILSFEEEMGMLGKTASTRVLKSQPLPYNQRIYSQLEAGPQTACYHLERLRLADSCPFVHAQNYLSLERFPGLDRHDFEKESLYRVLKQQYGVVIIHARRSIFAKTVGEELASLLEIPVHSAVLVIENTVYDQYDRPVEFSVESIAGDSHRYDFDVYQ